MHCQILSLSKVNLSNNYYAWFWSSLFDKLISSAFLSPNLNVSYSTYSSTAFYKILDVCKSVIPSDIIDYAFSTRGETYDISSALSIEDYNY